MVSCTALLLLALAGPLCALRRQSKGNATKRPKFNDLFPPKTCTRALGIVLPAVDVRDGETCKDYCDVFMEEPCPDRNVWCRGYEGACRTGCWGKGSNGMCSCSSCPGRELSKKEMWHRVCDGACGSDQHCYFAGMTFVGEQMQERLVSRLHDHWSSVDMWKYNHGNDNKSEWKRRPQPRCSPCILKNAVNPKYGDNRACAACADDDQSTCLTMYDDLARSRTAVSD